MHTLPEGEQIDIDPLQNYKNIFIKVNKWGMFEPSDIERNWIQDARSMKTMPDFVTTFEQELVRKPRLHPDVRCFLDLSLCGSILTGQCRCILHCRCSASLDRVLRFPMTRSPKTNLTRKRAMPSDWRCCIPHFTFRFTKKLGNRRVLIKIPSGHMRRARPFLTRSFIVQRTERPPPRGKCPLACLLRLRFRMVSVETKDGPSLLS